jgi:hypothetical protein
MYTGNMKQGIQKHTKRRVMAILNIISPFVLKKKINILVKKTKFLIFEFGCNGN